MQKIAPPDGKRVRYGIMWPAINGRRMTDLEVELVCFLRGGTKQTTKYQHCIACIGAYWPNMFVHPWFDRTLQEYCKGRFAVTTGCANSTKSHAMAIWGLLNYAANALDTLIFVISTNLGDAERRVWKHVVEYHGSAQIPIPGEVVHSMHKITLKDDSGRRTGNAAAEIALVAAGDNTHQALKKLQGAKNKRVIVLCDEMQDVSPSIERAIWNLIKNPYFEFRGVGNPSEVFDFHGRMCEPIPELGGHSLDYEDLDTWPIKHVRLGEGTAIHFNSLDSPNFQRQIDELPLLEYLPMPDDVLAVRELPNARELPEVWRQEIGVWPKNVTIKQTVFSQHEFAQYRIAEPAGAMTDEKFLMSIDPAWVEHGDDYVISILRHGSTTDQSGVIELVKQIVLKGESYVDPLTKEKHVGSHARAWETKHIADSYKITGKLVAVDATGALSYADILDVIFGEPVLRIIFSESASDDLAVSLQDDRVGKEAYANKATEMWQQAHAFAEHGQLRGISDPTILKELSTRKYNLTLRGKQIIESKKDFKKRTGGKSPDRSDSFVGGVELARQRLGAIAGRAILEVRQELYRESAQRAAAVRPPTLRSTGGGVGTLRGTGGSLRLR